MQQRQRQVGAHALAQAELARECMEDVVEAEQLAHQAEHALVARPRDVPHHALPFERRRDGVIPPQLGALAEDHTDAADVAHAVAHRIHAERAHAAGVRSEQTRQELDRGALAGAVRAGVGDHLAASDGQVDAAQRLHQSDARSQQVADQVAQAGRAHALAVHLANA